MSNAALIEQVKTAIRTRPENWKQTSWADVAEYTRPEAERDEICGTTMCTAGWALYLSGIAKPVRLDTLSGLRDIVWRYFDGESGVDISHDARVAMGLSLEQANQIFFATGIKDPEKMCDWIDYVASWDRDPDEDDFDLYPEDYYEKYNETMGYRHPGDPAYDLIVDDALISL